MTGETCGAVHQGLRHTWVCKEPPHDAGNVHQDNYRRRAGKVVRADRHVFVPVKEAKR